MNLLFRVFLFAVLTLALLSQLTFADEFNVIDADPFHHGVVSDEHERLQHSFSAAGASDHVILKAASQGDARTVMDILRHDPDLLHHENPMGWSTLTFAAANGHLTLLRSLLEAGADPNHAEKDGWTPLMFAAFHGDEEAIYLLLDHGANPLLQNQHELTAHELARLQSKVRVADVLGQHSVFSAMREKNFATMLFHLEQGISPNIQNPAGWTPLIAAIDAGERAAAEQLLHRLGADVNQQEHDGWTPLMFAAFKGDVGLTDLLLQAGANVQATARNREQVNTAIEMAHANGHSETVDLLKRVYDHQGIRLPGSFFPHDAEEEAVEDHLHAEQHNRHRHEAEEAQHAQHHLEQQHQQQQQQQQEEEATKKQNHHINNNKKKRGGTGFFNW